MSWTLLSPDCVEGINFFLCVCVTSGTICHGLPRNHADRHDTICNGKSAGSVCSAGFHFLTHTDTHMQEEFLLNYRNKSVANTGVTCYILKAELRLSLMCTVFLFSSHFHVCPTWNVLLLDSSVFFQSIDWIRVNVSRCSCTALVTSALTQTSY